ncbi:MAG: restriction endonuclease subunit S [Saprospiraceae bacterium]|nr:restriction endonuclease subunit S [Saprospiraceae bacterium]
MKNGWKMVKLGEVLRPSENQVSITPFENYPQIGVRLWGEGAYAREDVLGSETQYKFFYKAEKGDLTFNKIWVRNGAVTVIPETLHGFYVSPEFPVYHPEKDIVSSDWLYFLTKSKFFWDRCNEKAFGTSGKNRVKPSVFLQVEIPLPPLTEQQRIAGRLAALKGKMDAVRALRGEQEKELASFRNGLFKQICNIYPMAALNEVLIPNREVVAIEAERDYKQITVKMQHKGVILRGMIKGGEVGSVQFRAKEGDFIISKIDARNGAMGLVPKELHNAIVTNDFPLFSCSDKCLSKYFEFVSNTEYFDQKCIESSEGTTNRVRLKMDRFGNIEIPLPPLSEQKRVVEILEKMEQLKAVQAGQLAGLEGLFPAVLERAFRGEW